MAHASSTGSTGNLTNGNDRPSQARISLDFAFFELDMLFDDWVVFANHHLVGHRPRVFLCDVEVACSRTAYEPDFLSGWLGH